MGPEMAVCVPRRGAALSSVSVLNGLVVGGRFRRMHFTGRVNRQR